MATVCLVYQCVIYQFADQTWKDIMTMPVHKMLKAEVIQPGKIAPNMAFIAVKLVKLTLFQFCYMVSRKQHPFPCHHDPV